MTHQINIDATAERPSPVDGRRCRQADEGRSIMGIGVARKLRQTSTVPEVKLWQHLRDRRFMGLKFRRQYPVGPYVVDFVCFEPKLIVEVDGGQHLENARDLIRDKYFERRGYRVLRYWNNDVHSNLDGVLITIAGAIDPSPGVPHRSLACADCVNLSACGTPPSPSRGEGNSSKWPA